MNKIVLVCVDYNSENETKRFIDKVISIGPGVFVVLVCNSGSEQFSNYKNHSHVYVYDFEVNLGYMQGAERGLNLFIKDNFLPDWVILSNTDIDFKDCEFFSKLAKDNRYDLIIAPNIVTADSVNQNPFLIHRCARKKLRFLTFIYSYDFAFYLYNQLSLIKKQLSKSYPRTSKSCEDIYAPHGAFIIFGKKYFEVGNDLSHPCFLYGEELLIAERARMTGIKVFFDSSYEIIHNEHVVTAKINSSNKRRHMKDSISYLLNTYF